MTANIISSQPAALPSAANQDLQKTAGKAYFTALLLTSNLESAAAAVLAGIQTLGCDDLSEEALFRGTIDAAIQQAVPAREPSTAGFDRASALLPPELRRVLSLTTTLRQAYVLRVLVGLAAETCGRLLHLSVPQVDERTCAAHAELIARDRQFRSTLRCRSSRVA